MPANVRFAQPERQQRVGYGQPLAGAKRRLYDPPDLRAWMAAVRHSAAVRSNCLNAGSRPAADIALNWQRTFKPMEAAVQPRIASVEEQ